MSDGRDGSGQDLERVAQEIRTRADRGVTLSSLGVGTDYDERFMSRVADSGRGNYEFLRDGAQVGPFLARELQQATRTTVERAVAELHPARGLAPRAGLRRRGRRDERHGELPVGALAAGEERRLVLDLAGRPPAAAARTATVTRAR